MGRCSPAAVGNDPANRSGTGRVFSDGVVVKKLPVALALLAAVSFSLAACHNDDVPTTPPTTTTTSEVPVPSDSVAVSPSESNFMSPSESDSVSPSDSVSASDDAQNDVPGDGGV